MKHHKTILRAAGIEFENERGRADLHALRHTFGTMLSKSGVAPRVAMELMRHTDLRLTMKVYTDPRLFDLNGAGRCNVDFCEAVGANGGRAPP